MLRFKSFKVSLTYFKFQLDTLLILTITNHLNNVVNVIVILFFYRWLEGVKNRCAGDEQTYNWIINQVRPTLNELGVSLPEELGFGVPELALKQPHEY